MGGYAVVVTLSRSAALTNNSNKSLQGSAGLSYAIYRPALEGFFLFFLCSSEDLRLTTNSDTFTDQTFNM